MHELLKYNNTMLSVFCILFFLPHLFASNPYTKFTKINLPRGVFGPESVALDRFNKGPYVGVSDGRILKYSGDRHKGFEDFAYTAPNRDKKLCDGVSDPNLGPKCGRPLGFSFNPRTGFLYIVDAYVPGLYRVGPGGGQATLLADSANNVPFNFLNGIDVDPNTGFVYFTDASLNFSFKDVIKGNLPTPGDSSGRLIQYNPKTNQVKVLLEKIPSPSGPAVNKDSKFLLFSKIGDKQVWKYWLVRTKAGETKLVLTLPGQTLKIKRAPKFGEFWVAVNEIVQENPRILKPFGYKFNSKGEILVKKDVGGQYPNTQVNVFQEYIGGKVYVGSRSATFVGIYDSRAKW